MNQPFIKRAVIEWEKIGQDSYLRRIPALEGLEALEFDAPVTCFVGENGSGKSTLLEAMAIAAGFNPEGGSRNYHFSTYDSHSELWRALRLVRGYKKPSWGYFLRAESFYNVATREEEYADFLHPSEKYHEKSHGESFLAVAQKYLTPGGLYFLDEPEAALLPPETAYAFNGDLPVRQTGGAVFYGIPLSDPSGPSGGQDPFLR